MNYYTIIVWYNHNTEKYFFRKYKTWLVYDYRKVGYRNKYDHEVIIVIDLFDLFKRKTIKKRLINRAMRFLEKIDK